ncbi:glutathione S-transferase family protein [Halioxenophilus sp. WMMB6]|uniref:glutathione S-transferase family protein n=1 Tax=Halioxenophilus sp. WMMB6 TaxID=3073815 RepID=UPI00295F5303|nr:glutathione S-transferase family protein [Halioxenophilus sp. WMMB6]
MSLIVYGSKPSPYVRRIRMLLADQPHEFRVTNIYDDATRQQYADLSPIRKLPILVADGETIFDSHVIASYLFDRLGQPQPTLAEHNLVSAVDAVTDSLIIMLMTKNSNLEVDPERLLWKLQLERIPDSLAWLERQAEAGAFNEWGYPVIALITLVEWVAFRGLYDFSAYPALLAACSQFAERPAVTDTRPE